MANGLFGGGTGNPGTPFLVEDAQDLNAVRTGMGKVYMQVANIDMSEYANWVPIGTSAAPFLGIFDGGNLNISNLKINVTTTHAGLFGYATGHILGVNVLSGSVTTTSTYAGAICGYTTKNVINSSNQGCTVTKTGGTATTQDFLGGLGGYAADGFFDCFNTANVVSTGRTVGGILGNGTVRRSYNAGSVSTTGNDAAGINGLGSAVNCYNIGSVSASATAGSAAGISGGSSNDCYNSSSQLSGFNVYGAAIGTGSNSYNTANLTAPNNVFGVSGGNATNCYNSGELTSTNGIVYGVCNATATRCINYGNLTAKNGVYGITSLIAKNSYALNATVTRSSTGTGTAFYRVTSSTSTSTIANYALDTMQLNYNGTPATFAVSSMAPTDITIENAKLSATYTGNTYSSVTWTLVDLSLPSLTLNTDSYAYVSRADRYFAVPARPPISTTDAESRTEIAYTSNTFIVNPWAFPANERPTLMMVSGAGSYRPYDFVNFPVGPQSVSSITDSESRTKIHYQNNTWDVVDIWEVAGGNRPVFQSGAPAPPSYDFVVQVQSQTRVVNIAFFIDNVSGLKIVLPSGIVASAGIVEVTAINASPIRIITKDGIKALQSVEM